MAFCIVYEHESRWIKASCLCPEEILNRNLRQFVKRVPPTQLEWKKCAEPKEFTTAMSTNGQAGDHAVPTDERSLSMPHIRAKSTTTVDRYAKLLAGSVLVDQPIIVSSGVIGVIMVSWSNVRSLWIVLPAGQMGSSHNCWGLATCSVEFSRSQKVTPQRLLQASRKLCLAVCFDVNWPA